jgi:hypothetical protein
MNRIQQSDTTQTGHEAANEAATLKYFAHLKLYTMYGAQNEAV